MTTQAQQQNGNAAAKAEITKVDPRQLTLKKMFENQHTRAAISQVVPRHLTAERILKVALAATARTPLLLECSANSILQSVMQAAQLGLEPNTPLGHCYLVPFKNKKKVDGRDVWITECTPIVGYKGMIDLARRSSHVATVDAHAIHEKDHFDFAYGLTQRLEHVPCMKGDRGEVIGSYAIARMKGGEVQFRVCTRTEIDAARARSKSGKNEYGPWTSDYAAMGAKTAVRRLASMLPMSVEIRGVPTDLGAAVDEAEDPQTLDAETLVPASTDDLESKLERKANEQQPPPREDLDSEFGTLPGEQP